MAGLNAPLADAVPALQFNGVLPGPYAEYISNRAMGVANGVLGWEEQSQFQLTYDVFLSEPGDLAAAIQAILGTAQRVSTPTQADGKPTYVAMFYGTSQPGLNVGGFATVVGNADTLPPNKTWMPGFWVGKTVYITGGAGAGASGDIISNTNFVLGVSNLVNWPAGGLPNNSTFFIGTPYMISRTLPMRFPWPSFQHMVASRIASVQFYRFAGKAPQAALKNVPNVVLPAFAKWNRARITVAFEAKPYPIITDADLRANYGGVTGTSTALINAVASPAFYADGGYEFNRFVEIKPIPSVYAITRQSGSFVFSEGPPATAGINPAGSPVPVTTGTSQQLGNLGLDFTWYNVPEASIFPGGNILSAGGFAQNQYAIIGTVNRHTWGSFVPGVLLVQDPRIEPMPAPFQLSGNVELTHRLWKVTVRAKLFNPQPAPLTQGWNIVPYVGDGIWYAIKSLAQPDGATLYQYQDITYAFTSL